MLLGHLSPDRPSRWTLADNLIEDWFERGPELTEPGFSPDDVAAAEGRLGVVLPDSLREWYLQFGHLSNVWNVQERLIPPAELELEEGKLVIFRENQNVVQWPVEASSLHDPDPPVVVTDPSDPHLFHLAASSVSEFVLQMLALNAKFSDRELFRANGQVSDAAAVAIDQHLRRLPFGDLHWPPYPTRLYGDDTVLVEVDAVTWIWITAREAPKFDAMINLVEEAGVEWQEIERPEP